MKKIVLLIPFFVARIDLVYGDIKESSNLTPEKPTISSYKECRRFTGKVMEKILGEGSPLARIISSEDNIWPFNPELYKLNAEQYEKSFKESDSFKIAKKTFDRARFDREFTHELQERLNDYEHARLLKEGLVEKGGWRSLVGKPLGIWQITPEQKIAVQNHVQKVMKRKRQQAKATAIRDAALQQLKYGLSLPTTAEEWWNLQERLFLLTSVNEDQEMKLEIERRAKEAGFELPDDFLYLLGTYKAALQQ